MRIEWAVLPIVLAVPVLAAPADNWSAPLLPLSDGVMHAAKTIQDRQSERRQEPPTPALPGALSAEDASRAFLLGPHHALHLEIFSKYAPPPANRLILEAIDRIQSNVPNGGGYFTGVHADPPESPIGFPLMLGAYALNPSRKRTTSFCTGASYSALIGALGAWLRGSSGISADRLESLKMEEPDGTRREDGVKFWGRWNADDFGAYYALVQYSGMGTPVRPEQAQSGDFMTVDWKNDKSHSVVFLGWYQDADKGPSMLVWSSQESTNGLGDYRVPLSRVKGVKIVRLTDPSAIATFDPAGQPLREPAWDRGAWFPDDRAPKPGRSRRKPRRRN